VASDRYPKPFRGLPHIVIPRAGQPPPGAPPLAPSPPRLPSLHDLKPPDVPFPTPGANMAPPPAPPNELETDSVQFQTAQDFQAETLVFSTQRRWRAIDVYVQIPTTFVGIQLSAVRVKVWAITEAGRFLVASGFATSPANGTALTAHIASARTLASRFDVTVSVLGAAAGSANLVLSYVASDQATTSPPNVGVIPVWRLMRRTPERVFNPFTDVVQVQPELVKALVSNLHAANTLYWQVLDAVDVAAAAGSIPRFAVTLRAGETIALPPEMLAGFRTWTTGLVIGGSSTPDTFTASNDVQWMAWMR
jgi:hypothetical protein